MAITDTFQGQKISQKYHCGQDSAPDTLSELTVLLISWCGAMRWEEQEEMEGNKGQEGRKEKSGAGKGGETTGRGKRRK